MERAIRASTLAQPEPLGAVPDGSGVNFAVASSSAEAIFVSLFDAAECETACVQLPGRLGDVFHGHIAGIGPGARYGLRAHGRFEPERGHRFNCAKLLVDPFATRLDRPFKLDASLFDARIHGAAADDHRQRGVRPKSHRRSSGAAFQPPRHPNVQWRDLVIYEMHVRGFTKRHPDIPESIRGTFAGLAHEASIDYLKRLGVTAVELLPIAAWIDERHLPPLALSNYWGYNPVAMLAPDPRLAPGGWADVRGAVDALHAAGIAVILDVVLNHTGESDEFGPTLSMRGLDNAGFYRLQAGNRAFYVNDAGCGNVPALERPPVMRLALEALRTSVIARGCRWLPLRSRARAWPPRKRFRSGSPAACGDRAGSMAQGFDPYRRTVGSWPRRLPARRVSGALGRVERPIARPLPEILARRFRLPGALATRLAGSADIFAPRQRPLSRSVNFVTAHDGFTLADLVAFESKRNAANGEDNRDGTNDNLSWNCGVEGPTDDAGILARRAGDVRALLVTLFAARGTPMLYMGDELGRSQGGNNNAYAQDNELAWIDWASADASLIDFVARLIRLRRSHGALNAETPLTGGPVDATGIPDVEWLTPQGQPFTGTDWNDPGMKALVAVFYDPGDGNAATGGRAPSRAAVLINAGAAALACEIPGLRKDHVWSFAIDSAIPDRAPYIVETGHYTLASRSVAILVEQPSRGRLVKHRAPLIASSMRWSWRRESRHIGLTCMAAGTRFPEIPNALCWMPWACLRHRPGRRARASPCSPRNASVARCQPRRRFAGPAKRRSGLAAASPDMRGASI